MRKLILSLGFAFLLLSWAKSQENIELKEIFNDAEYFFSVDDYKEAYQSYLILYNRGYENDANINYKLGVSSLNIDKNKKLAISYLGAAVKDVSFKVYEGSLKQSKAPVDAFLYLGNALRINQEFDKAIDAYNEYKKRVGDKDKTSTDFADQEIKTCAMAKELMAKPLNLRIKELDLIVNRASSQYNPVVSEDENVLAFMESEKFYEAVFYTKKKNGKWAEPTNITPAIESDGNMIVSSLSLQGDKLYFQQDDRFNSDVYQSSYVDGNWQKSKPVKSPVNSKFWESNASISPDGTTVYFASNRSGGFGGMDIYKSELNPSTGQWGAPINLGPNINTSFNEDCPIILADGKTLAFSSQGHYNMGGYDLFYSKLNSEGQWEEAQNAGYPINSTDDELNYFPIKGGKVLYVTKPSTKVQGKSDIYRMEVLSPEESALTDLDNRNKVNGLIDSSLVSKNNKIEKVLEEKKAEQIVFRPVFFDYNEFMLNQRSKADLNVLARSIKESMGLVIELNGNTDSKGDIAYNQKLSEKRAEQVRDYLIELGIPTERLIIKGLGKIKPIAINNNDDGSDNPLGRRLNRRVDFIVLKGNSENIIVEKVDVPENLRIK
jgi:outer membrane protein OmpA-like peptidoglycan-associated protein